MGGIGVAPPSQANAPADDDPVIEAYKEDIDRTLHPQDAEAHAGAVRAGRGRVVEEIVQLEWQWRPLGPSRHGDSNSLGRTETIAQDATQPKRMRSLTVNRSSRYLAMAPARTAFASPSE